VGPVAVEGLGPAPPPPRHRLEALPRCARSMAVGCDSKVVWPDDQCPLRQPSYEVV